MSLGQGSRRDMGVVGKSREEDARVRWFVMRAHKSEKKAEAALCGADGMEYFIPKRYAVRTYHGVKSKRLVPAVPDLVFVHASRRRIADFKRTHDFLQFVTWRKSTGTEYVTVPDAEMDSFVKIASQLAEDTVFYRPEEIETAPGARVRVHGGRFDGVTGTLLRVQGKKNRRVTVVLEGVLAVSAEVRPDLIEIIP